MTPPGEPRPTESLNAVERRRQLKERLRDARVTFLRTDGRLASTPRAGGEATLEELQADDELVRDFLQAHANYQSLLAEAKLEFGVGETPMSS